MNISTVQKEKFTKWAVRVVFWVVVIGACAAVVSYAFHKTGACV